MKRILLIFTIFISISLFAKNSLEQARKKLNQFQSYGYKFTAFYPNPETDEIKKIEGFCLFNKFKNNNFDFYQKTGNIQEFYANNLYSEVDSDEKSIYQYEKNENQEQFINTSNIVKYGPGFLLRHNWNFVDYKNGENGEKFSHYFFIEDEHKYESTTIKVEYHIYISAKNLLSKFERKSFVDNVLGQTVTYQYDNYRFSKKNLQFPLFPKNFALKYFEKSEINPVKKGTLAPSINTKDTNGLSFSNKNFLGNKTLILFSSTRCGASEEVFKYLHKKNFILPNYLKFVNFYTSDKTESVKKYFNGINVDFQIIANNKDIEEKYQISGFPVMYLVDEKGIISETFDGSDQIIKYLRSISN